MFETRKRSISVIKLVLLIGILAVVGILPSHISVTLTPSLNHRVYFLIFRPDSGSIRKGDYILFNMSKETIRQFTDEPHTDKIMKIVGCAAGSVLKVENRDYYCDEVYLGRAKEVSLAGKPISHFVFNGEIPQGKLFVIGEHRDSFDSRYFGFIDARSVIAKAYPLF